ncbi:[protein-PII] uridylyltransferase [Thermodesulfobacteriota bacterium]
MTIIPLHKKNGQQKAAITFQKQREQLISDFLKGRESAFTQRHTRLLDDYLQTCYEDSRIGPTISRNQNAYAMIALGGYGRSEQCLFSDVDLLFLFKKGVPQEADQLVKEVVYPLWDLGLEVGHTTLTVKESIRNAAHDFETLTSFLDARFICGNSLLYSGLMIALKQKVISRRLADIFAWLVNQSYDRHLRFGDSSYLLEPNLKEGQGGLRDYHTMLWIARLKSNLKLPRDLEMDGYLSHDEYQVFSEAVSFVWRVRNRLHYLAGRKSDQLHFEYQVKLAEELKFNKTNGQSAVEIFLGTLHGRMETLKQQHLMFLHELGYIRQPQPKRRQTNKIKVKGLTVRADMLYFSSSSDIVKSPGLLMSIFEESARLKIPLSAEAKRLVKEFSYLADQTFRTSDSMRASFENILVQWVSTFNVLNEMLQTGFLFAFIPEMKKIADRIQYDEYHLYPVDKHSLRTVQILKGFGVSSLDNTEPLCRDIYKGLKNKKVLLWAALLHDIGKGEPEKDHSGRGAQITRALLESKGLNPKHIETVTFLVQHHLFLIKIATRRNIDDEETAILCARQIGDSNRLEMLYLLTVADSIATGPNAWNDWTSTLLRDLFLKVLSILEKGELATKAAVGRVQKKKETIMRKALLPEDNAEAETLFNVMSPRYLLYTDAGDILEHIKLYRKIGSSEFVWKVDRFETSDTRAVTVCAKDCPGLFSKIAGVFTLNRLDILDVKVYTWRNNIALDIFKVTPPADRLLEDEKWLRIKEHLNLALSGGLDLNTAIKQMGPVFTPFKPMAPDRTHRIKVDNHSSSFFTIVEVLTYDFPGLLFLITDALFKCRLDIWVAKIATKVDQIVDVFYVRDFDGQKVDSPDQVSTIKAAIEEVLPKGP